MNSISQTKRYKCSACKTVYVKERPTQKVCGAACAKLLIESNNQKKAAKAAKIDRVQTRAKLDAMKSKPQLLKEAQTAFNAYIRARDSDKPCICCGQSLGLQSGQTTGGAFDAGHYLSVGAYPHLRFSEDNVHGQRKYCNTYLAGNVAGYRAGLIKRIGPARVEALEGDNTPRKYSHDELRHLTKEYKAKLKAIKIR